MRWRELRLFLLGAMIGAAALIAFATPRDRRVLQAGDAAPAANGESETSGGGPRVAIVLLGVFIAAICGIFAWRIFKETSQTVEVARALTLGDAARAPALMIRYGCAGCHTIPGVPGADGQVGPELSGLVHRVYIGGTLANTPDHLTRWIVDPQEFSPHSAMPPPGLSPREARDIAAYLYAH